MNTIKNLISFLIILCCTIPELSMADAGTFSASVSSNNVAVGDQFQITFTLNSTGKNFRSPSFVDFNVLMGPSQSTNMQIINGSVSQSISFTYVLQAIKEGTFKIGPAEVQSGSDKLYSNSVTITVSKGASQQSGGSAQRSPNNKGVGDNQEYSGKNVFIAASVDKRDVVIGEGIAVTYKLYTKVTLLNYGAQKMPSLTGFWSQEISMPQQLEFAIENYDGVNYKVAVIKKVILFPQRSGQLTIDPMESEVIARIQTKRQKNPNDPWDQFFNDPFFNNPFFNNNVQDVKLSLKSQPIKINVRDLPAGAPSSFGGAVGRYTFEATLDKKKTPAHEPVTLKIKITGKGNLKLISSPVISFPPDFETYDPKETVNASASNAGVTGTKTFEYLAIPRNGGTFKINVQPFSYYDLEKRKYETVPVPEIELEVEKGNDKGTTVITGTQQNDVQMIGKDIRYIKSADPDFLSSTKPFYGSPGFYSMVGAPAVILAGLLIVRRKKIAMEQNSVLMKSQRANKIAMQRLSMAKKYLQSNERDKFLDEMFRALWGFAGDKLRIEVADLSKEKAREELALRNVPTELAEEYLTVIDNCEFARFAGGAAESNDSLYKKGIDVISKLENAIKL